LLPAGSVIFEVIWLATSLLLTVCDDDTEHEHAAMPAIRPAAVPQTSNARTID
jgi:hypothetical protein